MNIKESLIVLEAAVETQKFLHRFLMKHEKPIIIAALSKKHDKDVDALDLAITNMRNMVKQLRADIADAWVNKTGNVPPFNKEKFIQLEKTVEKAARNLKRAGDTKLK